MIRYEVTYVGGKLVVFPHVREGSVERNGNFMIIGEFGEHSHSAMINLNNVLFIEESEESEE